MKEQSLNRVENMVSKGEIACFEPFLLLCHDFKKLSAAKASESAYMRERVKRVENIVAKGENCLF